jgi:hypothetical protein
MRLRRAIPLAVPLVVIGVFVVRGSDTGTFPDIRAPQTVGTTTLPPPPTAPVDLTGISIPGVEGTTTTAPVRSAGTAHLAGFVRGPNGPVPGAVVRLEHLVGDTVTTDVVAGPDGHYDAPNIAGGRYRVHAFLAPTYAQAEPEVFFLNDGDLRGLDLAVRAYGGLAVASATAPDPPVRDDPATFVVRVATRAVDSAGIVRVRPVANATVQLVSAVGWVATGSSTVLTNENGDASFTLVCVAAGANQVQAQVQATAADAPQPASLTTPTCIDRPPPPPPTTAAPPSSAPPASAPN